MLYLNEEQDLIESDKYLNNECRLSERTYDYYAMSFCGEANNSSHWSRYPNNVPIVICKEKNRTVVEYPLKSGKMSIGVATYTTSKKSSNGEELNEKINLYSSFPRFP
ncbi:hypothetical protein FACS189413_09660 [Bacteroidia bacterium]|nr:hypothetical protein FACS189413_09660 [Bacteroidia bacterium]